VEDMARSLAFYRRLGLEVPSEADGQPHVDVTLPGGIRLTWDTIETIRSFDPDWIPPSGGHRIALAFKLDTPAAVDRAFAGRTRARWLSWRSTTRAAPCSVGCYAESRTIRFMVET